LLYRKWFFVLRAKNGETVFQSQMYKHKQSALDTIASIKAIVPVAGVWDAYEHVTL
jgi:uncharacterized protein YegP (UPF0339 family)